MLRPKELSSSLPIPVLKVVTPFGVLSSLQFQAQARGLEFRCMVRPTRFEAGVLASCRREPGLVMPALAWGRRRRERLEVGELGEATWVSSR